MQLADQDTVKARTAETSEFRGPGRLIFGRGAVAQLAKVITSLGAKNALIVADRNVIDDSALQAAIGDLRANCSVTLMRHDGSEPSLGQANQLANEVRGNVDIIVAIGGGSTIDIAKAVAVVKVTEEPLQNFEGADRIGVYPLPLIAIPTTAGTGSEVTGSSVLIDEIKKRKVSIRSSRLLPKVAILDPNFLATVPRSVIRATGVDALGHALEAYFSTSGSVITDRLALGAISLLANALPNYYANPSDAKAAEEMAWGSNIAGIAITSARVGLAHAVAAGIGALTGLPHGICVGLALPDTVRLNLRSRTATRDELMFHLGVTAGNGENWEAAVRRKLAEVQASVDFPKTARDAGQPFDVDDDLIDKIVGSGRLDTNPVQLSRRTLRGVLTSISG